MNFNSFLLIFFAIKFSFCPEYPRMVMHYSYNSDPKSALANIKQTLENEGFKIIEYAPEDGFLFTDYKEFNWGTGRRIIAITAHVHDKIVITGMGSMDIPVTNLGKPHELLKIKKMDRLPYRVQKKIFLSLSQSFEKIGLNRIYN
ncbi:MAG: hypothetical protein CBE24_04915 [bacterium TMED264]|nr:MAG: hypothetical protein CBE24_04915 [bacterium TMED264]